MSRHNILPHESSNASCLLSTLPVASAQSVGLLSNVTVRLLSKRLANADYSIAPVVGYAHASARLT
uniref:Transcriptional regulator n=1 Tax=Macrostomum lignano TaxID=282301 RepID=A0A1I8FB61_9PLAT